MKYVLIIIFLIYLCYFSSNIKFLNKSFNYNIINDEGYSYTYSIFYDDFFYEKEKYVWESTKVLQYLPKGRLLDVCCGTGTHYKLLNKHLSLLGIDKSKFMIDRALEKNPNGKFINEDIININIFKKFDGVMAFFDGIFYNYNWKNILNKLKTLSNKYLFISFLDKNNLENLYLKLFYKNTILFYNGTWNNTTYNEEVKDLLGNIIYKNIHKLYLPTEKDFLDVMKDCELIEKIRYDKFNAKDEILYIFKK